MIDIMRLEQFKELYANYLMLKPESKHIDYKYKAGDKVVTVTEDQGHNGQVRTGD